MEKTFNEMRVAIVEALTSLDNPELLVFAEEVLKKAKKGSGIRKDSQFQIFKAMILGAEDLKISEDDMWLKFKAGRHEALTLCRQLRTRVPEGEAPIWAQDIEEDGVIYYKVLGVGEDQPEDYLVRRKRNPKEEAPEDVEEKPSFESEVSQGLDIH